MIMDGYELIPMKDITDEARKLAVLWMECDDKNWIGQKHKLASDIMNYARKYHESEVKKLGLFKVSHSCFIDKIADKTTYIKGSEYDWEYRNMTIPVIEYNELKELAKEFDNANCG